MFCKECDKQIEPCYLGTGIMLCEDCRADAWVRGKVPSRQPLAHIAGAPRKYWTPEYMSQCDEALRKLGFKVPHKIY